MSRRLVTWSGVAGILVTAMSMLVEYQYCMGGPGRGFPFAVWRPGHPDGPVKHALYRQPVRRDIYSHYRGKLLAGVVNPYEAGSEMKLDTRMWKVRYGLLKHLVRAAAIDNAEGLRRARKKLIEANFPPPRRRQFNDLPPDIRTAQQLIDAARKLQDKTSAERIVTDWQRFFRDKYSRLAG